MKLLFQRGLKRALIAVALTFSALPAVADVTYFVTIDTSTVSGSSGFLDFQFNPGNASSQLATAQITAFNPDGGALTGVPSVSGSVVGVLPSTVTFTNSTALNEYFQGFSYGTKITFLVTLGGPAVNSPNGTATAGSTFGVGLYDSAQNPILTNQGAGTGFAGQIDINLDGSTTATAFPASSEGGPSVVTFSTQTVQVCKVAGAGVAVGTPFTFNVAGTVVIVAAGTAPGGTCGAPVSVPPGNAVITETLPAGIMLTAVSTLPSAGLLVSSNLAMGTATVTVNAGQTTIVTFTDAAIPTTGLLQVCKVAGTGVALGTPFGFNVAGSPVIVPAGAAPGGSCSTALVLPAGPAVITETLPAGITLTTVSTSPSAGLLVSSNLAAGTATVTVIAGGQTIVTFTDAAITGLLQVCKVAGSGVAVGTPFGFNVAGSPVFVPAGAAPGGSCSAALVVPAGPAVISETMPAGIRLTAVSTSPSAGLLVSSNLAAGTATVTVNVGVQTIVTFTNAVSPDVYQVDYLPAVAGGGIAGGYIDITNDGALGADGFGPLSGTTGRICANVYVFTADEQESECCSCLVTPNALVRLTAADLIGNPGNGVTPTLGVVVKLLATIPGATASAPGTAAGPFTGSSCNAASTFTAANFAPGMRAWATKFHTNSTTSPATTSITETTFSKEPLSPGELAKLTGLCQFLSGNQSGAGLCKACTLGGLGAGKR